MKSSQAIYTIALRDNPVTVTFCFTSISSESSRPVTGNAMKNRQKYRH